MTMQEYLDSIEYAVANIINLIHQDQRLRRKLLWEYKEVLKDSDEHWGKLMDTFLSEEDEWEAKTNSILVLIESDKLKDKAEQVRAQYNSHITSITILSGTLLQYAKQAISTIHGSPYRISANSDRSKSGREIGTRKGNYISWKNPFNSSRSENLRVLDLIIAARNQSAHAEEGLDDG